MSTGRYLSDEEEMRAARRERAQQRRRVQQERERASRAEQADLELQTVDPEPESEDEPAPRPPGRERREPRARRAPRERPERRRRGGSDLLQRILVAVPLAIIAIIFVDVGGVAFAVLMALVSVLCLIELYRMLERWHPVAFVGYGAAVVLVAAAHFGTDRTVLEIAMASVPVVFLGVIVEARAGMATVSIAGTLLGVFWVGLGFAHAELLRELPHGNAIVIDVMVGTFLADTGAYFGGRAFGRRPLAPTISPNKTVEGLGLGMLTAIIAVFIAGRFQQTWLTEGDSLLLGIAVAVLGPIGDLFESVVKRDAGTKDAGTLFGAHGGALDRLDALIFTVVAGYYVWAGILH